MGIRFACHVCEKQLNIKRELAGRRGVCPACSTRFRIPLEDAERSIPLESAGGGAEEFDSSPATSKAKSSELAVGSGTAAGSDLYDGEAESGRRNAASVEERAVERVAIPRAEMASLSLLDDEPDATWYVRPPSGGQYGPASSEILRQWIDEGRVASSALLWRDGWPQWREASEALPEIAIRLPSGKVASRIQPAGADASAAVRSPSPKFSGDPSLGSERRARSIRRVLLIGFLLMVALALIGLLVIVANRS